MLKKIISYFMGQPQGYISETDKFLTRLRKQYPRRSISQVQEIDNHEQIASLRDGHGQTRQNSELWRDF